MAVAALIVESLNRYNDKTQRKRKRSRIRESIRGQVSAHTPAPKLPPPGSSEAAAAAALRTHDDVCSALPAAGHTDRVFEALHAVSGTEGSLDRRLTYVRRKHLSRCALTVHVESRTIQCCFNCHSLLALHHLLLRLTS